MSVDDEDKSVIPLGTCAIICSYLNFINDLEYEIYSEISKFASDTNSSK